MGDSYSNNSYVKVRYFSRNIDDTYDFKPTSYKNLQVYSEYYTTSHSFTPEIFLSSSRAKAKFIDDNDEIKGFVRETFEILLKKELPDNMSIHILPFGEFKDLHSRFGRWSNGILGFSINGNNKVIFVMENRLDALMIVIGHEIGHVLTETLPNKHDEEAKAFAFSIEWAKTIKKHNIANLALSIKDEIGFQPARNGLHDVAFSFVDFMVKRGRKAIELHDDLVRKYSSVFNIYSITKSKATVWHDSQKLI